MGDDISLSYCDVGKVVSYGNGHCVKIMAATLRVDINTCFCTYPGGASVVGKIPANVFCHYGDGKAFTGKHRISVGLSLKLKAAVFIASRRQSKGNKG